MSGWKIISQAENILPRMTQAHNEVNFHKTEKSLPLHPLHHLPHYENLQMMKNPISPPLTKSKKKFPTNKTTVK